MVRVLGIRGRGGVEREGRFMIVWLVPGGLGVVVVGWLVPRVDVDCLFLGIEERRFPGIVEGLSPGIVEGFMFPRLVAGLFPGIIVGLLSRITLVVGCDVSLVMIVLIMIGILIAVIARRDSFDVWNVAVVVFVVRHV